MSDWIARQKGSHPEATPYLAEERAAVTGVRQSYGECWLTRRHPLGMRDPVFIHGGRHERPVLALLEKKNRCRSLCPQLRHKSLLEVPQQNDGRVDPREAPPDEALAWMKWTRLSART